MTRNQSAHLWLAQFAERLLEHFPEMNPLSAVKRAIAMYPDLDHLDAVSAADRFAAGRGSAGPLAKQAQQHTHGGWIAHT